MLMVGFVAGIPGLLVLKGLVREIPFRAMVVAVLVGAGPATVCVLVLGPIYQLQAPVTLELFLLHRGTLPPLVEESVKAIGIAGVLLALGGVPLSRRHGKAIGAAVGLGLTIAEVAEYAAIASTGDVVISAWGQLVLRMGLLGLTGHAVASALVGVGVADALGAGGTGLRRRARRFAPWLALAILTHGLMNTLGAAALAVVTEAVEPAFDRGAATFMPLQAVWLGMLASVLVAQGWAILVLWRWGRTRERAEPAPGPAPDL
jgi:RsiW-degrading membrane proteinase PrsW (M82 family)